LSSNRISICAPICAARELKEAREARIETLLQLIASAAATSPGAPQRLAPSAGILDRDGLKRVEALMKLHEMIDQLDQPFLSFEGVIGGGRELDDGAHDATLSVTMRRLSEE
jgi:hypothetical protein